MEQEFENRFIVDVKSETHRKALDCDLSYLSGVVYNLIAYDQEHFGECKLYKLPEFLHITNKELNQATADLYENGLININDGEASLRKWTIEELREDPVVNAMMDCFIELMKQKGIDI